MAVTKSLFGKSPEGKEISLYTLSNSKGMKAAVTDLGATLCAYWYRMPRARRTTWCWDLTMVRAITATTAFSAR